jgi:hypothetical protein
MRGAMVASAIGRGKGCEQEKEVEEGDDLPSGAMAHCAGRASGGH